MVKVILFDHDDTLVQSYRINVFALKQIAKKYYNLQLHESTIQQAWGLPYQQFLKVLFGDVDTVDSISDKYQACLASLPLEEEPHAAETIKELHKNYILGIVTASEKHEVLRELKRLGFDPKYFAIIQAAEDTIAHKPDPKVFAPVIKHFAKENIAVEEMMYIGNALDDMEAAQKAHIKFCGFARTKEAQEAFRKYNVPVIRSLAELLKMV